jgi:putative ABC transport system substrate-binding protein
MRLCLRRREFITLLGGAAAWPLAARAQQGNRVRRIGVLVTGDENDPQAKTSVSAFTQAPLATGSPPVAKTTGVVRVSRWTAEVAAVPLVTIMSACEPTNSFASARIRLVSLPAHRKSIRTLRLSAQPKAASIVARLNQPAGNISGFATNEASLGGKWLELLLEFAPGLKRAAIMFNPDLPPASAYMPSLETAARSLKVELISAPVHSDVEIETAINGLRREPGGGRVVLPDGFTFVHRVPIMSAAARNNVPAVYAYSYFARDGGLLSYGPDQVDIWRRAASYVDRILRGAKPGDLPVQFPTKFEMVLNLKTAKALGLTVPPSIRLRADEVIE